MKINFNYIIVFVLLITFFESCHTIPRIMVNLEYKGNVKSKRHVFFKKSKDENKLDKFVKWIREQNDFFKEFGITEQEKEALLEYAYIRYPNVNFQQIDHLYKLTLIPIECNHFYFYGFHHDYQGNIKKTGKINFSSILHYDLGFYKSIISYNGNSAKFYTFFPDSWSRKRVFKTILNSIENQESYTKQKDKIKIIGYCEFKGYRIKIKSLFDHKLNFKTAYPIL